MNLVLTDDHRYMIGGVEIPGVTSVLKDAGLVDDSFFTEWGRERGSAVHKAISFWIEGDLDEESIDPQIIGYLAAAKLALRDIVGSNLSEPRLLEHSIACASFHFAGTPDLLIEVKPGLLALIDWKTGAVQPEVALQLAAYQHLVSGFIESHEAVERFAVQLGADGRYSATQFEDENDINVFLAALAVRNWRFNNGKL